MVTIEKLAKSLNTIINKVGADGVAVSPKEVILADGTNFITEFIQQTGDGIFLSNEDGSMLVPFTDIADIATANEVYDLAVSALAD